MFYHVKDLQFNARVSKSDPAFATLLLEQFGGANGELAAALRYFGQAFGAKKQFSKQASANGSGVDACKSSFRYAYRK
jgi:Mn-containing catalase